jgi:hypothetical protein
MENMKIQNMKETNNLIYTPPRVLQIDYWHLAYLSIKQ